MRGSIKTASRLPKTILVCNNFGPSHHLFSLNAGLFTLYRKNVLCTQNTFSSFFLKVVVEMCVGTQLHEINFSIFYEDNTRESTYWLFFVFISGRVACLVLKSNLLLHRGKLLYYHSVILEVYQ